MRPQRPCRSQGRCMIRLPLASAMLTYNRPLYATLGSLSMDSRDFGAACAVFPRRPIVVLDASDQEASLPDGPSYMSLTFWVCGQWPGSRIALGLVRPPRPCSNPSAACCGTSLNIQPLNLPKVMSVRCIPQRLNEPSTGRIWRQGDVERPCTLSRILQWRLGETLHSLPRWSASWASLAVAPPSGSLSLPAESSSGARAPLALGHRRSPACTSSTPTFPRKTEASPKAEAVWRWSNYRPWVWKIGFDRSTVENSKATPLSQKKHHVYGPVCLHSNMFRSKLSKESLEVFDLEFSKKQDWMNECRRGITCTRIWTHFQFQSKNRCSDLHVSTM